ncbi:NUDIX domain-containing protein [Pseudooctadecabacter jejudonensis]|uniref:RNA pyrophosphohydrolase n=1 Tax=Pseudooctadecabacter jejudonensis TaxID=1391910 RepID=A0A1Y5S6G7_9RHOB|nr:NUDIX hydrolase [Pseudooctadecabacter jejudonensis]SLN33626.1 RNA pyrophosphohydrolase [Pseudooctadecabacter jejudonensis]
MIRRYGERVDPAMRYTPRPGAYVILQRGADVLLTVQDGDAPELQLPGGGIDAGEHTLPALHREVMEETGWRMDKPRRLGVFKRFVFMPEYDLWAEKICTVYWSQPTLRMGPPTEEGHHAIWVPMVEAPALLTNEGDAAFVASLL